MIDFTLTAKLFAALFAIMGPLSIVPIFLALTADATAEARRSTLIAMIATVTIGALVCALSGHALLELFGIDVDHFRLAGGLIVLMIALSMLSGDDHPSHQGSDEEKKQFKSTANAGVYPLGLPIALGPGTMATIIVYAQAAHAPSEVTAFYVGLVGYLIFFAGSMALAPWLGSRLSPTALSISKRLMGIILAAIAMEMIGGALGAMFPGWLR
ncbi:MarC family protein [Starkeya sp. ORNL1]|uniref:MarC family protein n=1 Tax=Starkeya sp. ORNL1 TaxID=2709380 RepID=UPI001FEFB334|nr:MarC family protein [Starkeya sp. ORNL1]